MPWNFENSTVQILGKKLNLPLVQKCKIKILTCILASLRFSTIKKSINRRTFERKQLLRAELKHIKELSSSIKEDKKQENVAKKQRRAENAQRRLENERKSEVVQVIKNTAKMKRMKKKALRKIEKRDLTSANGPKVV